jgi:hypothetical protein
MPRTKIAAASPAIKAAPSRKARRGAASSLADSKSVEAPAAPQRATPTPGGKLGVVVGLLRRQQGATINELSAATGWQKHSVRGALAGSLKRKHGLAIVSTPAEGGRVYRIEARAEG